MKLSEYRQKAFAGTPPSINWLKKQIDAKEIEGEVIGGRYFVHISPTGNELADKLIEY